MLANYAYLCYHFATMKTKMSKQLVFIDDSGDPGFKKGVSSANLIMAAVFFDDTEHAR